MKFLVNRVDKGSVWTTEELQGCEVIIDEELRRSHILTKFARGMLWDRRVMVFCRGFTIAEIDDEGYLM